MQGNAGCERREKGKNNLEKREQNGKENKKGGLRKGEKERERERENKTPKYMV